MHLAIIHDLSSPIFNFFWREKRLTHADMQDWEVGKKPFLLFRYPEKRESAQLAERVVFAFSSLQMHCINYRIFPLRARGENLIGLTGRYTYQSLNRLIGNAASLF